MAEQETEVVEENTEVVENEEAEVTQEGEQVEGTAIEPVEEVVVTIGDEEPPEDETSRAPDWVRDLRKKNRDDQKRIRELEDQLKTREPAAKALGKKPVLEDFDYDANQFETALEKWFDHKRELDNAAAKADQERQSHEAAWNEKLKTYGTAKESLGVKDYDDTEAVVLDSLNTVQQGIIIQGAENSALVFYALGKNPAKVKELAAISDPIKFAFSVAKLEARLKVTKRTAPAPEKRIPATSGKTSSAISNEGDRLLAEAQKSGDMTKYRQWSRQQRSKAA